MRCNFEKSQNGGGVGRSALIEKFRTPFSRPLLDLDLPQASSHRSVLGFSHRADPGKSVVEHLFIIVSLPKG